MALSLKDLVVHEIGLRDDLTSYEKAKNYFVMAKNGLFKIKSTDVLLMKEQIAQATVGQVPMLDEITEGVEYLLPKIPFKWYLNILDFFKYVYEKDHTEASCLIYYNNHEEDILDLIPEDLKHLAEKGLETDGKWIIYAPQQKNHATLTDFRGDDLDAWFKKNVLSVIECHSHHTMNAFWSGTDNANQKEHMYYGVFGHINTEDKFLLKKIGLNQRMYNNLDVTELFEFPQVTTEVKVTVDSEFTDMLPQVDTVSTTVEPYKGVFQRLNEFPMKWYTECHSVNRGYVVGEFDDDSDGLWANTPSKTTYFGNHPKSKQLNTPRRFYGDEHYSFEEPQDFNVFDEADEITYPVNTAFENPTNAQYSKEDLIMPSSLDVKEVKTTDFESIEVKETSANEILAELGLEVPKENSSVLSFDEIAKVEDLNKNN